LYNTVKILEVASASEEYGVVKKKKRIMYEYVCSYWYEHNLQKFYIMKLCVTGLGKIMAFYVSLLGWTNSNTLW